MGSNYSIDYNRYNHVDYVYKPSDGHIDMEIFVLYTITVFVSCPHRDLVRTGATGASAPAEIWQRVRRTRPEDSGLVSRTAFRAKNCQALKMAMNSKI